MLRPWLCPRWPIACCSNQSFGCVGCKRNRWSTTSWTASRFPKRRYRPMSPSSTSFDARLCTYGDIVQRRYQPQSYLYFGLLLIGLLLSTISRRIEPLCMVLPLACALVCSRLARPKPVLHLDVAITPN